MNLLSQKILLALYLTTFLNVLTTTFGFSNPKPSNSPPCLPRRLPRAPSSPAKPPRPSPREKLYSVPAVGPTALLATLFISRNTLHPILATGVPSCKDPDLHMNRPVKFSQGGCPNELGQGDPKKVKAVCLSNSMVEAPHFCFYVL